MGPQDLFKLKINILISYKKRDHHVQMFWLIPQELSPTGEFTTFV